VSFSYALQLLSETPDAVERAVRAVPADSLHWMPQTWDAMPAERFSVAGQVCHLRDIEIDGYHLRFRRLLDEENPDLVSLDGYVLAERNRYQDSMLDDALREFRDARAKTIAMLRDVTPGQLQRPATWDEYGPITLLGLIHYLGSHDQQHLAALQWLMGKITSR